jgi:hypothetical protein
MAQPQAHRTSAAAGAQWYSHRPIPIHSCHFADCELVREFDGQLLKLFATRDEKNNLRFCLLGVRYALSFQSFVPSDTPARAVGGHG